MEDPGRFNRWLRFNGIGALGAGLQLAVLGVLTRLTPLHYLWATAVAVEATVLHNFCWHERWTWSDRRAASRRHVYRRLGHFQLTNGLISVAGNLVLMRVFAGILGMDTLAANIVSILICSLANFGASEWLVFRRAAAAAAVSVMMLQPMAADAAGATPTARSFRRQRSRPGLSTSARSMRATTAPHRRARAVLRPRRLRRGGLAEPGARRRDSDGTHRTAGAGWTGARRAERQDPPLGGSHLRSRRVGRRGAEAARRARRQRAEALRRRPRLAADRAARRPLPDLHEAPPLEGHHGDLQHRARRALPPPRAARARAPAASPRASPSWTMPARRRSTN